MTSYEKFKEAHKILYFIKIFYPQYYSTPFDGSFQILYEVWEEVLEEYSVDLIKEGIKSYVKSDIKGVPPTPGQVLSLMLEFMEQHVDYNRILKRRNKTMGLLILSIFIDASLYIVVFAFIFV